jgi:hypothetical protein
LVPCKDSKIANTCKENNYITSIISVDLSGDIAMRNVLHKLVDSISDISVTMFDNINSIPFFASSLGKSRALPSSNIRHEDSSGSVFMVFQ